MTRRPTVMTRHLGGHQAVWRGQERPFSLPRFPRPVKLDAYRGYIRDRLAAGVENAGVLLPELRAQGATGSYTILKSYLQPLRLRCTVTATVRFETNPGKQAQVDVGRFPFLTAAVSAEVARGVAMVLAWSRAFYLEFPPPGVPAERTWRPSSAATCPASRRSAACRGPVS